MKHSPDTRHHLTKAPSWVTGMRFWTLTSGYSNAVTVTLWGLHRQPGQTAHRRCLLVYGHQGGLPHAQSKHSGAKYIPPSCAPSQVCLVGAWAVQDGCISCVMPLCLKKTHQRRPGYNLTETRQRSSPNSCKRRHGKPRRRASSSRKVPGPDTCRPAITS